MSAADFLFTPTIQRVLAATLPDPARSFYMRELVALAEAGKGNAQRQVEKLIAAGVLLEDERKGRQRSIRANAEFFLYPELRSIACKSFALREPLLSALHPFAAAIDEAFVFGSMARGDDTGASDIDLVVIGTVPLGSLSQALVGAEQQLGRAVHLNLYQPDEWRELVTSDAVLAQIARGPKLVLIQHAKTT